MRLGVLIVGIIATSIVVYNSSIDLYSHLADKYDFMAFALSVLGTTWYYIYSKKN